MPSRELTRNIAGWDIKCPCCNATGNALVSFDHRGDVCGFEVKLHRRSVSHWVERSQMMSPGAEQYLRESVRRACAQLGEHCDREQLATDSMTRIEAFTRAALGEPWNAEEPTEKIVLSKISEAAQLRKELGRLELKADDLTCANSRLMSDNGQLKFERNQLAATVIARDELIDALNEEIATLKKRAAPQAIPANFGTAPRRLAL